MIGHRLKLSRAAAGLSLRQLADKAGRRVTAQAISKYERDLSTPDSEVLLALAAALGVSVDYLFGDDRLALEAVDFRRRSLPGKRAQARVEARVLQLLERYLAVERLLGLPSVTWDRPRQAPWPVPRAPGDAEHAARELRALWELGLDPIPNLTELLEERGIKVLAMRLPGIDGLTARARGDGREAASVVVVNGDHRGERQRFTAARELGHMVLDVAPKVDAEAAAQHFAGAFLMPADTLRAEIGARRTSVDWRELFELKPVFGVSAQALVHRCRDLGIFGRPLFQRLIGECDRRGWRRPPYREPAALAAEQPRRFRRLCLRALAESAITIPKAAELLGQPAHELDRLLAEPPDGGPAAAEA